MSHGSGRAVAHGDTTGALAHAGTAPPHGIEVHGAGHTCGADGHETLHGA